MKVGTLTFHGAHNYGSVLQAYALQVVLNDVVGENEHEIINFRKNEQKAYYSTINKGKGIAIRIGNIYNWLYRKQLNEKHKKFEDFIKKYLPLSKEVNKSEDVKKIVENYEIVICGSDQVWNPDITGNDLSYFLDFCGEETRRISYAPSFGVEELSESYGKLVKQQLLQFSAISVREEAGKKLIQDLTGRDPQLVIDPTRLMDWQEWECCEKEHPAAVGEYILYYTVRSSQSLWKYCLELAQKRNIKILRIGSNFISKRIKAENNVEYVCDVSPGEWLYLIHHANCVVTNSFHGTAFAINYRKDFFVEFSSLTNSRLSNIVDLFGLEKQVVGNADSDYFSEVDYSKTEIILPEMQKASLEYLKRALAN